MAIEFITSNIWKLITQTVKAYPYKSMVAVAYFGQQAAKMLPLKKGSLLLVDASEKAVKSGQTCPEELLKLYYKGVAIYSLSNLHAKVYVVGKTLMIGSANVSGNSSQTLQEAIIKTNDAKAMEDAKAFIEGHCQVEMGEDQLLRLQKMYRPPKFTGVRKDKKKGKSATHYKGPSFIVYKLQNDDWTDEEEREADEGRKMAEKNRIHKSRHSLDEFIYYGKIVAKPGDTIMQIVEEKNNTYVSPPGTLTHIRRWSNGKKLTNFCFVEIPNKKRKNLKYLKKHFDRKTYKQINRNGRKNKVLAAQLIDLWK